MTAEAIEALFAHRNEAWARRDAAALAADYAEDCGWVDGMTASEVVKDSPGVSARVRPLLGLG